MAGALRHLDFSDEVLAEEAYAVARFTSGGFGYEGLREMPFPEYDRLVARAAKDMEVANAGTA